MTKAYFYETTCGDLHRCMFAGLDNDGHAQWVVIDQGTESMTLSEYLDEYCMNSDEIHLLCMEGELVDSATLASLLGRVFQSDPIDYKKSLSKTIKELRRMGIDWKHDMVKLKVHIHKYFDEVLDKECYFCSIIANGFEYLVEQDAFDGTKDVLGKVSIFFEAFEKEADIALKKVLVLDPIDNVELDSKDCLIFDVVS